MISAAKSIPYSHIGVKRLSGALGAEITGVDLARPVQDDVFGEIYRAFNEYLFIAFRDQVITPTQHIRFSKQFGQVMVDHFMKSPVGLPEIIEVVKEPQEIGAFGAGEWHSDNSYRTQPPMMSLLHAKELPPFGGDTVFANQYLAFETLSDGLRQQLSHMTAVHTAEPYQRSIRDRLFEGRAMQVHSEDAVKDKLAIESNHPVVRVHPDTGKRALYVNYSYVRRFTGWTEAESQPLLNYLFQHAVTPDFTCRFTWSPNTLLLWDNRCLQHIAIDDYDGYRRRMHRTTVEGETPRGPN
jgi:taurine dioxygenase